MRPVKRQRILVTGGAGFLGSHLCDRLLEHGHEVLCVDNFSSGLKDNVLPLMENSRFRMIRHDVKTPLDVQVDAIFNLACPASPALYQRDPIDTMRTNVIGANNVLMLARRLNAPVLQASTSEVYGDPVVHPQSEDYWGHVNPTGTRACYDEGKRSAETLFFDYHRQHRVKIKVARIFNTYGPRMNPVDGRVVSNLVVQALRNAPLTIYGLGTQTRSFCYVDDMVDALLRLMETDDDFTGPVNLGNPTEVTIFELAEKIIDLTGSASHVELHPLPTDDPQQRRPDISLARRALQWQPQIDLETGLKKTIAYFADLLHGVEGSRNGRGDTKQQRTVA